MRFNAAAAPRLRQIYDLRWHSLEVLEEGTVVFEAKDGRREALGEEDIMNI